MTKIFVGIDLGGTNIKIGCFDAGLNLIGKTSISTHIEQGAEAVVETISLAVKKLLAEKGILQKNLCAAGIGSPGIVDIDNGIVVATSNLKFYNVPLRQILSKRLDRPVILENDANVTCWAEYVAGAGKGADDMVLITLGTGIGGGVISNGQLIHGWRNAAGEIGHIVTHQGGRLCGCGQRGCVEAYSSASATAMRAKEAICAGVRSSLEKVLAEKGEITCKDVYDHSAAGDKLAREITDGTAEALAVLCVTLLHLTGPKRIIFYGGMISAGNLLLEPIRKFFGEQVWKIQKEETELCFATLGDDAGIIGAAALAINAGQKKKP